MDLQTFCGTALYAAPEIVALQMQSKSSEKITYTVAVDIWSLGVVILQYGYRLPKYPTTAKGVLAQAWPRLLVQTLKAWGPADFGVLHQMLVLDPWRRGSASACLQQMRQESAVRPDWTAVNNRTPIGAPGVHVADEEEATQVFDYAAIERSRTTLTPHHRESSRRQKSGSKESVSIHNSEIDAYIKPNTLRARVTSTIGSVQYLDAEGAHGDRNEQRYIKKRAKSSRSTPSTAVPSDRRPRQRRRKSGFESAHNFNSTYPASALALHEKECLQDPNWVVEPVVAIDQRRLDSERSRHSNFEDCISKSGHRNPRMTLTEAEHLLFFANNAGQPDVNSNGQSSHLDTQGYAANDVHESDISQAQLVDLLYDAMHPVDHEADSALWYTEKA